MSLKEKYTWLKHWDFILIDLACLIGAFFVAYYLRLGSINIFSEPEWISLLIIICCTNLFYTIMQSTYSGVLDRRYYLQLQREVKSWFSQMATICVIFYALKIGTNFSRIMMFTMYFLYFFVSQPIKYSRKKYLEKTMLHRDPKPIRELDEDISNTELVCIDNRNELVRFICSFIKRAVDIVGGIVGCIILIPLIAIVYFLNKLNEEDGPVFFVQDRIGKDGVPFRMIKFRSMVVNADEKLERFLEENEDVREEFRVYRKIKNDPRVTKVGAFLRKTSLDEFPQFINVLLGDMSLVGPRPYLKREVEDMGKYYDIIIRYKPGVTGLWQISGRSDVSFDERLEMDIKYHKSHSMWKDFEILLKTIIYVISKEGAV